MLTVALGLSVQSAWAEEETEFFPIEGTVTVAPAAASLIAPGDRMVIKLYHPDGGVEKDTKYQIFDTVELPYTLSVGPSLDMNGRARWPTYIIEVFTDRDGDVLSRVDGELFARTPEPVRLGTTGVTLDLTPIDANDPAMTK